LIEFVIDRCLYVNLNQVNNASMQKIKQHGTTTTNKTTLYWDDETT